MFHDVFSGCVTTDSVEAVVSALTCGAGGVAGWSWGTVIDPVSRKIRSVSRVSGSPDGPWELFGSTRGVSSAGPEEVSWVFTR